MHDELLTEHVGHLVGHTLRPSPSGYLYWASEAVRSRTQRLSVGGRESDHAFMNIQKPGGKSEDLPHLHPCVARDHATSPTISPTRSGGYPLAVNGLLAQDNYVARSKESSATTHHLSACSDKGSPMEKSTNE